MESIIHTLTTNKILLIIVILLTSLLIYSILKKLVKLIVIIIIALVLYLGFMDYKGEKIDDTLQKFLNKYGISLKEIGQKKDKISNIVDSVNKTSK